MKRSHDLGDPNSVQFLSKLYSRHIAVQARMMEYFEQGVRRGSSACINDLVYVCAAQFGNYEEATRVTEI